MRALHLSIIVSGVAVAVAVGAITLLYGHLQLSGPVPGDSSQLALAMSTNSTEIGAGKAMGMDISLTNTSPQTLVMNPQHNWPLRKWSMGPCLFHLPFGIALMQGYYDGQNMTQGQRLLLYPRGVYMCKTIGIVDFVFEPSSTRATVETYNSTMYHVTMQYHVSFNGFYDGQKFEPFVPGVYTIVGDDQWGHLLIRHFTVR